MKRLCMAAPSRKPRRRAANRVSPSDGGIDNADTVPLAARDTAGTVRREILFAPSVKNKIVRNNTYN